MHTIDLPPYYRFGWSWWCWWCVSMLVKLRRAEPRLVWGGEGREEEEEAEEVLEEELELMMQVLETGSLVGERELGAEADPVLEYVTSGYQAYSIFFWIVKKYFSRKLRGQKPLKMPKRSKPCVGMCYRKKLWSIEEEIFTTIIIIFSYNHNNIINDSFIKTNNSIDFNKEELSFAQYFLLSMFPAAPDFCSILCPIWLTTTFPP